jgi:hypothetical protein
MEDAKKPGHPVHQKPHTVSGQGTAKIEKVHQILTERLKKESESKKGHSKDRT